MFACPLFREFRESDKAVKLKGANFDTIGTLIVIALKNLRSAHHYITEFGVLFVIVYCLRVDCLPDIVTNYGRKTVFDG